MATTGDKHKMSTKSSLPDMSGLKSLLVVVILSVAWVLGFGTRLFAVIRFESIIHEFDPWLEFKFI